MPNEPIFLVPVFKERIWGGRALAETFGYDIPYEKTGECWAISAHPHGQSLVRDGAYAGLTLGQLWDQHRDLFGHVQGDRFPLLTKILDANADLSVQVHPDDFYARVHERGELGKTECWYIIDCVEGAELIYGHTAHSKEQFQEMVAKGEWHQLLRRVQIQPGDFFFVPSGTIHALGAGTLVLETQQSSDTTYRVYDYDRRDDRGDTRELHLEKAIQVTRIPHTDPVIKRKSRQQEGLYVTTLVETEVFTVHKWELKGSVHLEQPHDFQLVSVLKGSGKIRVGGRDYSFQKGDHAILPCDLGNVEVSGQAELIVSHP